MGLDMSVYKYNKKFTREEFNRIRTIREVDLEKAKSYKEDYDNLSEEEFIRKYAAEYEIMYIYPKPKSEDKFESPEAYGSYLKRVELLSKDMLSNFKKETDISIEKCKIALSATEDEIKIADELDPIDIAYWRKHSDLNGLLTEMYHEQGGEEEFNCVPLYLSKEDIEELIDLHEKHLNKTQQIPTAGGFFWGATNNKDWENSLEDFKRILRETDWDNETVYYSCWY